MEEESKRIQLTIDELPEMTASTNGVSGNVLLKNLMLGDKKERAGTGNEASEAMEKFYVWEDGLQYLRPTKEAVAKYKTKAALIQSLTPEELLKYKAMAYDLLVHNIGKLVMDADEFIELSVSVADLNLRDGNEDFEKHE